LKVVVSIVLIVPLGQTNTHEETEELVIDNA